MAKIYGALEVAQLEWFTNAGKPAATSYAYRVIYITDLKEIQISDGTNWVQMANLSEAQTIAGLKTFTGAQIFTGAHRLSVTTEASALGAISSYSNVTPIIEFTGATTSLAGLSNYSSGQLVMIVNRTGSAISILDEDTGTTGAERIRTGTGTLISVANNASVLMAYVGDSRWHVIGGSGSGSASGVTNFISNGTAEADTTGWATYADAAGTSPVDGTGGSPNVTWTRSTSSPLVGTASFVFTKDAANRQGQGASYAFTVDSAYKAKVLQVSFEYMVGSGTFVAGTSTTDSDVVVYLYDVTNSRIIQPTTFRLYSNSSTLSTTFVSNFQTSSDSTSYRLILHCGSTSASAYTVKFDNIVVAPSSYVYGTPITDFQTYTPTFAGFGTVTSPSMWWRRVGDSVEIYGKFTSGTVTAATASFTTPNSVTIDSTKVPAIRSSGYYTTNNSARTTHGGATTITGGNTTVNFGSLSTYSGGSVTNNVTAELGNAIAVSGDVIYVDGITAPISGWGSNTQTSDQADSRNVSCTVNSSTTSISSGSDVTAIFTTVEGDTHAAYNVSTGLYTVPVSGDYEVGGKISFGASFSLVAGNTIRSGVILNGSIVKFIYDHVMEATLSTTHSTAYGSVLLKNLKAGDTIGLTAFQNGGSPRALSADTQRTYMSINRLSQASLMSATETVGMTYNLSSQSFSNVASLSTALFDTKVDDTHQMMNTSTGIATIKVAGRYRINASLFFASSAWAAGNACQLALVLTGSKAGTYYLDSRPVEAAGTFERLPSGNLELSLMAGDTVKVQTLVNRTAGNTTVNANLSIFSISRVGI